MDSIQDMGNALIEHSMVIRNFVCMVHPQLKDSMCGVFSDNVRYHWPEISKKAVEPDASINCNTRDRKGTVFTNTPRFVMEVLSKSTKDIDYGEKMEIYRKAEVTEYWIVNWQDRTVQVYMLDVNLEGETYYYPHITITDENKDSLRLITFPNIKVNFDELFLID